MYTIKENFISSDGWNETPNNLIHLEAPFASCPIKGINTKVSKKKENKISPMSILFQISKENLNTIKPTKTASTSLKIWLNAIDNEPSVKGIVTEATMTIPNKLKKITLTKIPKSKSENFRSL